MRRPVFSRFLVFIILLGLSSSACEMKNPNVPPMKDLFLPPAEYLVGANPTTVTIADFNRDGKLDIIVGDVWYEAGTFVNAALDKASTANERNVLRLVTPAGIDVTCVQVAGLIARRILCYVKRGDRVARGQRYGFIRFGSRVDVYLPADAIPRASVGDKVYATASILAELRG